MKRQCVAPEDEDEADTDDLETKVECTDYLFATAVPAGVLNLLFLFLMLVCVLCSTPEAFE